MTGGPPPAPERRIGRRTALRGTAAAAGTMLAGVGIAGSTATGTWAHLDLLGRTVALTAPGQRRIMHTAGAVLPGTRIAASASAADRRLLAADEEAVRSAVETARIDAGVREGFSPDPRALLRDAALDLHVLDAGLPAPVASWTQAWRYVWPRDAAHVAVAWAGLGLVDRASAIVRTLAHLARPDGRFEARYVPGTDASPDDREPQLDGTGWFLWALDRVGEHAGALLTEPEVAASAERGTRLLLSLTRGGDHLPPASPDYWEVRESRTTLATAALAAVGLERGGRCAEARGATGLADEATGRARALRASIADSFGPTGYSRYAGRHGADAGLAFLLPPYALSAEPAVAARLDAVENRLRRPAGGLAPGELWRRDGVSWTPQTALFAQARAATGDRPGSGRLLSWLGAHRTGDGSLPEKVLATGEPAAVAPLGWTAALVVTALLAPDRSPARP